MLEHKRQIGDECFITALAMATGKTVQSFREQYEKELKAPYAKIVTSTYDSPLEKGWKEISGRLIAEHFGITLSSWWALLNHVPTAQTKRYVGPKKLTADMLNGKGILVICSPITDTDGEPAWSSHAVAFEDGIVYDSGLWAAFPYDEWRKTRAFEYGGDFVEWRIEYAKEVA